MPKYHICKQVSAPNIQAALKAEKKAPVMSVEEMPPEQERMGFRPSAIGTEFEPPAEDEYYDE